MKWLRTVTYFLCFMILAGCSTSGTIYNLAADEREATAIVKDNAIAALIEKSFLENMEIKPLDLSVSCYNGHVYLVGEYEKKEQEERAVKIAGKTTGVKSVTAYLLPKKVDDTCRATDNLALEAKLKAKLVTDLGVWSTSIDFKVVQCHIILLGVAESQDEIDRAQAQARSVEGNRGVTSYLVKSAQ